ncbi:MAG: hypothetical protein ABJB86_15705 [Bacteroidota bacterium]
MTFFKFLWLFDTIIVLVTLGCFIFYLFKGPISFSITGTWILVLIVLMITMISAGCLKITQHPAPALLLLLIMSAPGFVYAGLTIALNVFRLKL